MLVAPLVGAWIETLVVLYNKLCSQSHPSWVRGLKHILVCQRLGQHAVAPLVGAWIETEQDS